MRLLDLNPRWLEHEGKKVAIMLLCPHCKKTWLSCFFVKAGDLPMIQGRGEEWDGSRQERWLFREALRELGDPNPDNAAWEVVGCNPSQAWQRDSDDFETMTVKPSLDASASGHWHGHIKKGMIV